MGEQKHVCTMPAYGFSGRQVGGRYLYSLEEVRDYASELRAQGYPVRRWWTKAGKAALKAEGRQP
jgi:hypothetical protein